MRKGGGRGGGGRQRGRRGVGQRGAFGCGTGKQMRRDGGEDEERQSRVAAEVRQN